MTTKTIACLVPVLNRPHRVRPLVESFHATGSAEDAVLYLVAQEGDEAELRAIEPEVDAGRAQLLLVTPDKQSWPKKINEGYARTSEPWMLLLGDDCEFVAGWLDAFRRHAARPVGVLGTADATMHVERIRRRALSKQRGRPSRAERQELPEIVIDSSQHPLVRRAYIDEHGTVDEPRKVIHDGYHHAGDYELCFSAAMRGQYGFAHDIKIAHLHFSGDGAARMDDTYRLGQSRRAEDGELFRARAERFGFRGDP